jgi:YHS domain-containing protein
MNSVFKRSSNFLTAVTLLIALFAYGVSASTNNGTEISAPVMGGYDPVAYFEQGKPVRGNGYHTVSYDGGTYLFATKSHKEKFLFNPKKYAPQFGGYCAYGVAVGKKFYSDPNRWKIVDGKLYLNLDKKIQNKWNEDITGYIVKADNIWADIEHKHPSEL